MQANKCHTFTVLALLALTLAAGCSSPGVVLKGTLQKDGKPYVFAENEEVHVSIVGKDADGKPYNAVATANKEDGSLVFKGPIGEGILPGAYKITVSSPLFSSGPKNLGDRFSDLASQDKTPLRYSVTAERSQEILIDVGKRTVTKK